MPKIEIIENHAKFRKGQVVDVDDIAASHATAFKYGRHFIEKIETQAVEQPETRTVDHVHDPIEIKPLDTEPVSFFKRRGRKPKA